MGSIRTGRQTASIEGSFVVFIIGVRINKLLAIRKWMPVVQAMGPMLKELYSNPELGFLDGTSFISGRGVSIVQYWRSYDQLEKYAHGATHLKAWQNFNRKSRVGEAVGIYHETYLVENGAYESIYVNMPATGLGRAGELRPIGAGRESSRERTNLGNASEAERAKV